MAIWEAPIRSLFPNTFLAFSSVSNGTYTYNCLLEAKLRIMCHIPMKKQCHYLLQLFQLHDFILFLLILYLDF